MHDSLHEFLSSVSPPLQAALVTAFCFCSTSYAQFQPQDAVAFFRFVSTSDSSISAVDPAGAVTWSNHIVGTTGIFQRAAAATDLTVWTDYVQCVITSSVMTLRLFDPTPPPGMTLIPGGTNSGSDPDFGSYRLEAQGFHMDSAHVTKHLWDQVRNWGVTNGYTDLPVGGAYASDYPVYEVSWYDAVKWCNARSEREGRPVAYRAGGDVYQTGQVLTVACDFDSAGYRLPTVVEWEYAARGGLRGKRYPWGDEINPAKLNFDGTVDHTTVAGTYPANSYGLYDMAGNLWEWTWDWYPGHTLQFRTIRGGSWSDQAFACRCGYNAYFHAPYGSDYLLGFRTVLTSPREAE